MANRDSVMRCTKIYFRGYKRLSDTSCHVGPRLLAFVGTNEAGKSSVLEGLEWLTEDEETPLDDHDRSRIGGNAAGWVVGASFALSADDRALLDPLGFEKVPRRLNLWKQVNGSLNIVFGTQEMPGRRPEPFADALDAIARAEARLARQYELSDATWDEDEEEGPRFWTAEVKEFLKDPQRQWTAEDRTTAEHLADWFAEIPSGLKAPRAPGAVAKLREAAEYGASPHPVEAGIAALRNRIPKFVSFRDEHRLLPTRTPIDEGTRHRIAPAIRNLLSIAGVDPRSLWIAQQDPVTGEAATMCGNGNDRLDAFFSEAWNQSNVSIHLSVDADGLLTHVLNLDNRRRTSLEERSDGLRAFIALAAFLRAQELSVPPILLIDEAERHLHLDAQADLVGVLMGQVPATQIFYSTHSPGCLPSDMGTGIRLVDRIDQETSELKTHFWTNQPPGLRSLLYAMGASAAAFSAFRWAVLAEGATEMVLLPTLLRQATGVEELGYQIVPGLAIRRSDDFEVEEVAAKVAYLADGDKDGKKYAAELRAAGVDEHRVFTLPDKMATEDLLDPDYYIKIIADLMPDEVSVIPVRATLTADRPYARSLATWEKRTGVKVPGKVAVAYRVLEDTDVPLSDGAAQILKDLHAGFVAAFQMRPDGSAPA